MCLTQKTRPLLRTFTGSNPTFPCPVLHDPLKLAVHTSHTSRPILSVGRPTIDTFCYFFPSRLQQNPYPPRHSVMLTGSISMFVNSQLNTVWTETLAGVLTCGAKSGTKVSLIPTRPFLNVRNPSSQYSPSQTVMRISVAPGDTSSRLSMPYRQHTY